MPVMDGLTATRHIRAWEQANARPPVPIIALTASALKGDREMCLAAGCTAFLTKPIRQAVLLQSIREHTTGPSAFSSVRSIPNPKLPTSAKSRLSQRVPAYLAHCRDIVTEMRSALAATDAETVTTLGHNLRGSGGSFGFQTITDIGTRIELAAGAGDWDLARQAIEALSDYLTGPDTADDPLGRPFS